MGTPRIDSLDKNYIINGGCEYWQRSSSSGVASERSGFQTMDRFRIGTGNTAGTRLIERVEDNPNGKTRYAGKVSCDTTGTSAISIFTQLESIFVYDLVNQITSLIGSFKTDEFQDLRVRLQVADVIDDFSSKTTVFEQVFSLTIDGNWNNLKFENMAIMANVHRGVEVLFQFENPSEGANNHYVEWSQLKLNIGTKAQEFSLAGRNLVEEFQLCQRYYERGKWNGSGYASNPNTINFFGNIDFNIQKRVAPFMTELNGNGNNQINLLTIALAGPNINGAIVSMESNSANDFWRVTDYDWDADAEL